MSPKVRHATGGNEVPMTTPESRTVELLADLLDATQDQWFEGDRDYWKLATAEEMARVLLAAAKEHDLVIGEGAETAEEYQVRLCRRFGHWKPMMSKDARGAAAAVLFVLLPEELTDEDKERGRKRAEELMAEHPEWAERLRR